LFDMLIYLKNLIYSLRCIYVSVASSDAYLFGFLVLKIDLQ
jgi:hypothetical protein